MYFKLFINLEYQYNIIFINNILIDITIYFNWSFVILLSSHLSK